MSHIKVSISTDTENRRRRSTADSPGETLKSYSFSKFRSRQSALRARAYFPARDPLRCVCQTVTFPSALCRDEQIVYKMYLLLLQILFPTVLFYTNK